MNKTFKSAKLGDIILVHYDPATRYMLAKDTGGSILIPALVLAKLTYPRGVIIGWTKGQTIPIAPVTSVAKIHPVWFNNYGIIMAHEYGYQCEFVPYKTDPQYGKPIAKKLPEKACKNPTCQHMNDVGSSMCWWCQIPNPTA